MDHVQTDITEEKFETNNRDILTTRSCQQVFIATDSVWCYIFGIFVKSFGSVLENVLKDKIGDKEVTEGPREDKKRLMIVAARKAKSMWQGRGLFF